MATMYKLYMGLLQLHAYCAITIQTPKVNITHYHLAGNPYLEHLLSSTFYPAVYNRYPNLHVLAGMLLDYLTIYSSSILVLSQLKVADKS